MKDYNGVQLARKILDRDYERWIQYADECIKDRASYTKSFYVWKQEKGMLDEDAKALAEILG